MISMSQSTEQNTRIHPHKFTLWVAMAGIVMMFAGLTSAYIVKKSASNWLEFPLPKLFIVSTGLVVLSSITIQLALKQFKASNRLLFKNLIIITSILGISFIIVQIMAFLNLKQNGVQFFGQGSNASASFLGVIAGIHAVHILGGVIALFFLLIKTLSKKTKIYNSIPIEIVSTYWHFVGALWIYLYIFLNWVSN